MTPTRRKILYAVSFETLGTLVATLGLRNLIIVHTDDATLVADASQSERIKEVLAQLQKQNRTEYI